MLEKQKGADGDALVSTVLFDSISDVIFDRVPLKKMEPLTDKQYYVRGCTALLDALGGAIHHMGNVHKYAREEDRPEKTIFIITTDGQENSSRKYDYAKVKKLVERQQEKYGWEFLFLGANIDAIKEASRFGIRAERAANYECDEEGTKLLYRELSNTVEYLRSSAPVPPMAADWKKNIEADHKKRGKN